MAWRREKYVPRGGPAGGDGGDGGDVVLVADDRLTTLLDLRYRQHLIAPSGRPGGGRDKNGKSGEDLFVPVPVGTVVTVEGPATPDGRPPWVGREDEDDVDGDEMENVFIVDDDRPTPHIQLGVDEDVQLPATPPPGTVLGDLTQPGQQLVVARGGRGGRGNLHFRSPTNRSPDFAEDGTLGQAQWLRLELKLLADVGIVGFPNVGKSTLISRISRAKPKIGDYPFTTLVPQLGVVRLGPNRSMVVADVPGLIEGASQGKGLGLQFLRHLERTRVLVHLLAPDLDPEREPLADLEVLEAELAAYGSGFEGRPRVVALNKIDVLKDEEGQALVAQLRRTLRERNIPLFVISAHTGEGVDALLEAIWRRLEAVGTPAPASNDRDLDPDPDPELE